MWQQSHVVCDELCAIDLVCFFCCCRYIALQRDPRFKAIYEAYLTMFDSVGLVSETAPFMQFVSAGLPSK